MEIVMAGLMCMGVSSKVRTNKKTNEETVYRTVDLYAPASEDDEYSEGDLKKVNLPDSREGLELFNFFKNQKMKEVCILADYKPAFQYEKDGKTNKIDERFSIKAVVDASSIKTVDIVKLKAA